MKNMFLRLVSGPAAAELRVRRLKRLCTFAAEFEGSADGVIKAFDTITTHGVARAMGRATREGYTIRELSIALTFYNDGMGDGVIQRVRRALGLAYA